MRKATAVTIAALMSACSTAFQPVSVSENAVNAAPKTFDCVNGMINRLGFVVTDANKDAGFIKAQRKTSGAGMVIMFGANMYDAMTASVFSDPTSAGDRATLRLTLQTDNERAMGIGAGHRNSGPPSDALRADAKKILAVCAKGEASSRYLSEVVSAVAGTAVGDVTASRDAAGSLLLDFTIRNDNAVPVTQLTVRCEVAGAHLAAATNELGVGVAAKSQRRFVGVNFGAPASGAGPSTCMVSEGTLGK